MSSDANKVADMLKGAEDAQKQQQQQRDRKRKRESAEELPKKLRAKAEELIAKAAEIEEREEATRDAREGA